MCRAPGAQGHGFPPAGELSGNCLTSYLSQCRKIKTILVFVKNQYRVFSSWGSAV